LKAQNITMTKHLFFAAPFALLALAGCHQKESAAKTVKNSAIVVDCMVAQNKPFNASEQFAGVLLPYEEVELKSETSGKIVQLLFNEGDAVAKGQLLVKVNDSELQAQLKKNAQQLLLGSAEEGRRRELLQLNGISQEEYDKTLSAKKILEAERDYILASIEKTEVRAPFAGVIGLRQVSEGAFLSGTTTIATLRQLSSLKLEFSVPEKLASQIVKGTTISFKVASADTLFVGTVYAIEGGIDLNTRALKVRAKVDNENTHLIAGSYVDVLMAMANNGRTIMVPSRAIVPDATGETIYLIKNGKITVQRIVSGYRTANQVVIDNGVLAGDTVVLSGLLQVKPGMNVKGKVIVP